MSDDDRDVFDVFDIERSCEADEHLAGGMPPKQSLDPDAYLHTVVLEVTINLPPLKNYLLSSELEKIEMYKELWNTGVMAISAKNYDQNYFIEYCKSGLPHLHGYIKYIGVPDHSRRGLVMDFVRAIYRKLHRGAWRQIAQYPYEARIDRFKAPALCVNYKKVLFHGWTSYITKNARPSDEK